MKNQQYQQSKTWVESARKANGGRSFGIMATSFIIIGLTISACTSSSRSSTPTEIAAQEEHQTRLVKAQEEFQQKVVATMKETQEKSDSILKAGEKEGKYLYGK